MKFGVCLSNYGEVSSPDIVRETAVEAEDLGYHSVWVTDHILMPKDSGTPYERIYESLTSLAYLAGVTSEVKLGISSLVLALRNPIVAAKQLATIDCYSGGRLMLAVAAGWNETEFNYLGAPFHTRGKFVDEALEAIRLLWENSNPVSFSGKVTGKKFSAAVFDPKPVQKKVPIWIAGNSSAAMKRAAEVGDAWHPNAYPLEVFRPMVERFKRMGSGNSKQVCVRIALNPEIKVNEYVSPQGERRLVLGSNMELNSDVLSALDQMGVNYVVVAPNHNGKTSLRVQLDSLRVFAKRFL
ncbi:MAG: TIGR03619 family F420-dependent LLM class oxidoreductase [Thermoprotei archaeon]